MSWDDYIPLPNYQLGKWAYNGISGDEAQQDQRDKYRGQLGQQGAASGQFAGYGEGQFQQLGGDLATQRAALQRLASGQDSYSAEQLRQGLQQNLASQQSMAASASPANAVMAARNASMNMNRAAYGLSGQQALAGIQERQSAQQALANLTLGERSQDLQGALGARQNAVGAYGQAIAQNNQDMTWLQKYGGAIQGGLQGMAAMSDRRLKKNVKDGDGEANATLASLKSYTFDYKDERHGKGKQTGIMAQDLERAGLKQAVIETPGGKAVHGAKLATANTAMLAALARRVGKLEGKRK